MKKNQSECDLADGLEHRVHKEWQLLFSGVHHDGKISPGW
jgi:hypothetical protein